MSNPTLPVNVVANTTQLERQITKISRTPVELNLKASGNVAKPLGRITGEIAELDKSMEAANARVIAFGASAGAIFALESAVTSLFNSFVNTEKKLLDINVLLNLTNKELSNFGGSLFDIAGSTAQSFDIVAEAATELSRQGLGVEETLKRTEAALILTRLSGIDAADSVKALTAAINSFQGSALEATEIVNKLANVDAAFAVSSADLANAISRVGSSADDAGISFDELIALVTTAQQITSRGGSVIGNSLKTIFTRLGREKTQDLLTDVGVNLVDTDTGGLKSQMQLLKDLANVYDGLSQTQQNYVAEQVGGVFQINILKAALGDLGKEYSIYDRALQTSLGSTDQAIQRNEQLNQSISALAKKVSAGFGKMSQNVGEDLFGPAAKNVLGAADSILGAINESDSESTGAKIGSGLVSGIGNFLAGPGLALLSIAGLKLLSNFSKMGAEAFSSMLGTNKAAKDQAAIQGNVLKFLQSNSDVYSQIASKQMTVAQAAELYLGLIKQQTAEMKNQASLASTIARTVSSNVFVSGSVSGGRVVVAKDSKTKTAAGGFLPAMAIESNNIANGVGGARPHDKPVSIKNFNFGGGKRGNIVVHTGEVIVPNYGGGDGSAIFNRKMISKHGMPKGAKKITAADGFIPNFAKKAKTPPLPFGHEFNNEERAQNFETFGQGATLRPKRSNKPKRLRKGINTSNVENDDIIDVISNQVFYLYSPSRESATASYEPKSISATNNLFGSNIKDSVGKLINYKDGRKGRRGGLRFASTSAVDGYSVDVENDTVTFLEAKKNYFNSANVFEKYKRGVFENAYTHPEINKLFKEGDPNKKDRIKVRGILVQASDPSVGTALNFENDIASANLSDPKINGRLNFSVDEVINGHLLNEEKTTTYAKKLKKDQEAQGAQEGQTAASIGFIPNFATKQNASTTDQPFVPNISNALPFESDETERLNSAKSEFGKYIDFNDDLVKRYINFGSTEVKGKIRESFKEKIKSLSTDGKNVSIGGISGTIGNVSNDIIDRLSKIRRPENRQAESILAKQDEQEKTKKEKAALNISLEDLSSKYAMLVPDRVSDKTVTIAAKIRDLIDDSNHEGIATANISLGSANFEDFSQVAGSHLSNAVDGIASYINPKKNFTKGKLLIDSGMMALLEGGLFEGVMASYFNMGRPEEHATWDISHTDSGMSKFFGIPKSIRRADLKRSAYSSGNQTNMFEKILTTEPKLRKQIESHIEKTKAAGSVPEAGSVVGPIPFTDEENKNLQVAKERFGKFINFNDKQVKEYINIGEQSNRKSIGDVLRKKFEAISLKTGQKNVSVGGISGTPGNVTKDILDNLAKIRLPENRNKKSTQDLQVSRTQTAIEREARNLALEDLSSKYAMLVPDSTSDKKVGISASFRDLVKTKKSGFLKTSISLGSANFEDFSHVAGVHLSDAVDNIASSINPKKDFIKGKLLLDSGMMAVVEGALFEGAIGSYFGRDKPEEHATWDVPQNDSGVSRFFGIPQSVRKADLKRSHTSVSGQKSMLRKIIKTEPDILKKIQAHLKDEKVTPVEDSYFYTAANGFIPNFSPEKYNEMFDFSGKMGAEISALYNKKGEAYIEYMSGGKMKKGASRYLYQSLIDGLKKKTKKKQIVLNGELLPQEKGLPFRQGLSRARMAKKGKLEFSKENDIGELEYTTIDDLDEIIRMLGPDGKIDQDAMVNLTTYHANGFIPNYAKQKKQAIRGIIDGDALNDPKNTEIVSAAMDKLGISDTKEYHKYLSNLASSKRASGKLSRWELIGAVAGAGKSRLTSGRKLILSPSDIASVDEVADLRASTSAIAKEFEKRDDGSAGSYSNLDRATVLSTHTKQARKVVRLNRENRGKNFNSYESHGRSESSASSKGAPIDSTLMEGILASELGNEKLKIFDIVGPGKFKKRDISEYPEIVSEKIGLSVGSFSPFTKGHGALADMAEKKYGIKPENFVYEVSKQGGGTAKADDPHSHRTLIFPQSIRGAIAAASRPQNSISLGSSEFGFSLPPVFRVGNNKFLKPESGSLAFLGDDKGDSSHERYTKQGFKTITVARDNVSGTATREALFGGDMKKFREFMEPGGAALVEKNLPNLLNRNAIIPKLFERSSGSSRPAKQLEEIQKELEKYPKTLTKKIKEQDPTLEPKVKALRKQRDKIKKTIEARPAALMSRLTSMYPSKYGFNAQGAYSNGFLPNFASTYVDKVMDLESKLSGEKAIFDTNPFPHIRNASQPTFSSAMADHGGVSKALNDSVKMQKSAGLIASSGFIPNFAEGNSGGSTALDMTALAGTISSLVFTLSFLQRNVDKDGRKLVESLEKSGEKLDVERSVAYKAKDDTEKEIGNISSVENAWKKNFGEDLPDKLEEGIIDKKRDLANVTKKRLQKERKLEKSSGHLAKKQEEFLIMQSTIVDEQLKKGVVDPKKIERAMTTDVRVQKMKKPLEMATQQKEKLKKELSDLSSVEKEARKKIDNIYSSSNVPLSSVNTSREYRSNLADRNEVNQKKFKDANDALNENEQSIAEQKKQNRQARKDAFKNNAMQYGFIAQTAAGVATQLLGGEDTAGGALASAAGNIAGMAGTGFSVGGPWGAAAGTALGVMTSIEPVFKALTSNAKEYSDEFEKSKSSLQKLSNGMQGALEGFESYSGISKDDNSERAQKIRKQYQEKISELPIEYQDMLASAGSVDDVREVFSKAMIEKQSDVNRKERMLGYENGRGGFWNKAASFTGYNLNNLDDASAEKTASMNLSAITDSESFRSLSNEDKTVNLQKISEAFKQDKYSVLNTDLFGISSIKKMSTEGINVGNTADFFKSIYETLTPIGYLGKVNDFREGLSGSSNGKSVDDNKDDMLSKLKGLRGAGILTNDQYKEFESGIQNSTSNQDLTKYGEKINEQLSEQKEKIQNIINLEERRLSVVETLSKKQGDLASNTKSFISLSDSKVSFGQQALDNTFSNKQFYNNILTEKSSVVASATNSSPTVDYINKKDEIRRNYNLDAERAKANSSAPLKEAVISDINARMEKLSAQASGQVDGDTPEVRAARTIAAQDEMKSLAASKSKISVSRDIDSVNLTAQTISATTGVKFDKGKIEQAYIKSSEEFAKQLSAADLKKSQDLVKAGFDKAANNFSKAMSDLGAFSSSFLSKPGSFALSMAGQSKAERAMSRVQFKRAFGEEPITEDDEDVQIVKNERIKEANNLSRITGIPINEGSVSDQAMLEMGVPNFTIRGSKAKRAQEEMDAYATEAGKIAAISPGVEMGKMDDSQNKVIQDSILLSDGFKSLSAQAYTSTVSLEYINKMSLEAAGALKEAAESAKILRQAQEEFAEKLKNIGLSPITDNAPKQPQPQGNTTINFLGQQAPNKAFELTHKLSANASIYQQK
jgi:TP901 family phage tail tape measure protein